MSKLTNNQIYLLLRMSEGWELKLNTKQFPLRPHLYYPQFGHQIPILSVTLFSLLKAGDKHMIRVSKWARDNKGVTEYELTDKGKQAAADCVVDNFKGENEKVTGD